MSFNRFGSLEITDPRQAALSRKPDSILFGGVCLSDGSVCPQRMSYILLHALMDLPNGEIPDGHSFANISEWAVRGRQEAQREIVSYVLRNGYPDIIRSAMLGSEDGQKIRYELSGKKPRRALQRLKEKKYYASDYDGLLKLMDSVIPADLILKYSTFLNIASGMCGRLRNFELSDDIWLTAIELTMIFVEPGVYFNWQDGTQWVGYLEKNLRLLLSVVYYISATSYYSLFYLDNDQMIQQLKAFEAEADRSKTDLRNKEVELREFRESVNSNMSDKDALIAKMRKEIDRLTHENQELHARLDDFDSEDSSELSVREPEESDSDDFVEEAVILHDLPDDGILFIGGHPNMLSKLKPLYPNWVFVSTEVCVKAMPEDMRPKYIFIWSNHLSHALYSKVKMTYGRTTPIGYLTATNLDRLQFEMTKSYSDYLNNACTGEFENVGD